MSSNKPYLYYQHCTVDRESGFLSLAAPALSYYDLFNIFGKHHTGLSGDFKVEWSWEWDFVWDTRPTREHRVVYTTVYNWKDGPSYEEGRPTPLLERDFHEKRLWHIGGQGYDAVQCIQWAIDHKDRPRGYLQPLEADKNGQLILFK